MPERYQELLASAKKETELADHLIYVTYPIIKEVKFLLAITEHVITAARSAVEALLAFEQHYKRIEPFSTNFAVMAQTYKEKVESFYSLDPKFHRLLLKLQEIQHMNMQAPVKFKRGEKYILANHEYKLTTLDFESVKKYSNLAKGFVKHVEAILAKV